MPTPAHADYGVRSHPRTRRASPLGNERGVALIGVLLLTAAILALGIFGTQDAQVELNIAGNDLRAEQALALAEAGAHHAFALIKNAGTTQFDAEVADGISGALAGLGSIVAVRGESYRFRHLGIQPDDGYYVRVADNFDETQGANDPADDSDNKVSIVSRGLVGNAERVIQVGVERTLAFPYAIFGMSDVDLGGGMNTDSFDSRIAPYDPTSPGHRGDVGSNGDIDVNPVTVRGDARAGGAVKLGNGTVTGDSIDGAPTSDFPPVPVCGPPYSDGSGISGSGKWSYNPSTGVLDIRNSVTLADGKYCFSSIKESSHGVLNVNGPVQVYVTGEVDATGDGINNTTKIASNFLLFSSLADTGEGIKITAQADTHLAVYAPNTSIKVNGGADFFGAMVGHAVSSAGVAGLHYDEALERSTVVGPPKLAGWSEGRNF